MSSQLTETVEEEAAVFLTDMRTVYLSILEKLNMAPSDGFHIITKETVPKTLSATAKGLLEKNQPVMFAAKGTDIKKLVAIAELSKVKSVTQLNKIELQRSLINPSYSAEKSLANVEVFFGNHVKPDSQNREKQALREVRGHKVYEVPSMMIFLLPGNVKGDLPDWTVQKS